MSQDRTVNQRGVLPPLYPGPDSFLFFNAALSDKKQSYFTLHRLYLSPLLFLLKIPLSLPPPPIIPCTPSLYQSWPDSGLECKMKVTGGYHGTMRHRTHAEGFHALSAPHISTSAPHTQDPQLKAQHTGKHPLYHPPLSPTHTLTEAPSLRPHTLPLIKPQQSRTCPQSSQRQVGLLLMNNQ